jgi:DNA-binding MarR family transcriptional regulator
MVTDGERVAQQWAREVPDAPTEAIPVVMAVLRAAKRIADNRRRVLARLGLDSAVFDLLATLRRNGAPYAMSPADLARDCLVTAGAISQRVSRAEADGLVQATRGPGGRAVDVRLTKVGRRRIDAAIVAYLESEQVLVAGLSPRERASLTRMLDGLGRSGPPGG